MSDRYMPPFPPLMKPKHAQEMARELEVAAEHLRAHNLGGDIRLNEQATWWRAYALTLEHQTRPEDGPKSG